jgi:hypothetical protein
MLREERYQGYQWTLPPTSDFRHPRQASSHGRLAPSRLPGWPGVIIANMLSGGWFGREGDAPLFRLVLTRAAARQSAQAYGSIRCDKRAINEVASTRCCTPVEMMPCLVYTIYSFLFLLVSMVSNHFPKHAIEHAT